MKGKLNLAFDDLGSQQLKNIAQPVRVYSVRLEAVGQALAKSLALPDKPSNRGAGIPEYERRSGTRAFRGRYCRRHHHRSLQIALAVRYRPELKLCVQGPTG